MKNTYVAGVLCNEDGKFLLVKHNDAERWVFPGGKPEQHETAQQAIRRELEEEIGVFANNVVFSHAVPDTVLGKTGVSWFGLVFDVKSWFGDPRIKADDELSAARWFDLTEIDWQPERGIAEMVLAQWEAEIMSR